MANANEVIHGWMLGKIFRLREDLPEATKPVFNKETCSFEFLPHPLKKGQLVKVVMVSRFGDCGITDDLKKEQGYDSRVMPDMLESVYNSEIPVFSDDVLA